MKRQLPNLPEARARHGFSFDLPNAAVEKWNAALAAKEDDNTISIYDPIGNDFWGEGTTAKRIAAALRTIGDRDVVVNLNSPGGDLFEGIAIYNLLRNHPKDVTVRVIGLAASAGSVIAMAGDRIEVARAGFLMMHNVWVLAMGNKNDLREAADVLEPFDDALAELYAARSGMEKKQVQKMMDKETWLSGAQAIEHGFADAFLPADEVEETEEPDAQASNDLRIMDLALARRGMPRTERRALINRIKSGTHDAAAQQDRGTRDAAPQATQDAGAEVLQSLTAFFERQASPNP